MCYRDDLSLTDRVHRIGDREKIIQDYESARLNLKDISERIDGARAFTDVEPRGRMGVSARLRMCVIGFGQSHHRTIASPQTVSKVLGAANQGGC